MNGPSAGLGVCEVACLVCPFRRDRRHPFSVYTISPNENVVIVSV